MSNHTRLSAVLLGVVLLCSGAPGSAEDELPSEVRSRARVRIGIVLDGPWRRNLEIQETLRGEIIELTRKEFDVRFADPILGDWTGPGVRRALDRAYASPEVDVVLALGVLASSDVAHRPRLSKPTVAPLVIDPKVQDVPFADGTSGVHNLNYLVVAGDFPTELRALHDVAPFEAVAFLGFDQVLEAVPALADNLRAAGQELDAEVVVLPHADTPEATLAAVPEHIDAVVVGPLFQFTPAEFQRLVEGITARRLASLALVDVQEVDQGILVSLSPRGDTSRLARRVALNVQSILLGEDAGTLPVVLAQREQLTINMASARAIGVSPRWEVLTRAVLLNEEVPAVRTLSLRQAAAEAIAANLDLRVADREVTAGMESVRRQRAELLPQIRGRTTGVIIDDDRADAGFGATRARTVTGAVALSQSVYSDRLWAGLNIERHDQRSREQDREAVRLDVVRDATVAYLDVLRRVALERIERENLDLTRKNLDLAQVRVSVGVSDRSDEYRWESEIANDRRALIDAIAVRRQAEYDLNRILDRPIEEHFATVEAGIDDPRLLTDSAARYVDRPATFTVFRDFMVERGLERSPTLRSIDAAIAAQQRALVSAKRAFWLPDFSVQAEYADRLSEAGAGGDGIAIPGLDLPSVDDQDWTVSIEASLPLFTSGARWAEMRRANEDLLRLKTFSRATAQRVEQDIRSSLLQAQSSFVAIRLTRESADAARKNLDLVTDSYSRGVIEIITLLDAQNVSLVADQAAATAVFTFLSDWMRVQRAGASFDFLMEEGERAALVQKLDDFFAAAGVQPDRRR